jgi:serine/threonine protein phosphatase 1
MTRTNADGQLIYAIGDIHGCYGVMKAMLARIVADYAVRAGERRPILVFLGDYVDRGPHSHRVLEALVWLQRRPDIELHLLKGNHEQALLAFLDEPLDGGGWLKFGGAETLIAYGVQPPSPDEGAGGYIRARDELLARMPAAHYRLLSGLKPMVTVGDYAFVHAGIRPGVRLARQSERDLFWIRKAFLDSPGPHEKVIVHGHSWSSERPQLWEHRIGLDTGAYATGVLSAIRLDDGERVVIQVADHATAARWTQDVRGASPGSQPSAHP